MLRFDSANAMAITRDNVDPTQADMQKYPVSICITPPEATVLLKNLLLGSSNIPSTHLSFPALSAALETLIRTQPCGVVREDFGPMLSFKTNKEAWQSEPLRNLRVPNGEEIFSQIFENHFAKFQGFSGILVRKGAMFSTGKDTSTLFAYGNKVAFGSLPYLLTNCIATKVPFEKLPFNVDALRFDPAFVKTAPAPEVVMLMGTPNVARGLVDLLKGDANSRSSSAFVSAMKQTPLWERFVSWADHNEKVKKTIKKVEKVLANSGGSIMAAFYNEMIAELKTKHVVYAKKNSAGPKIKDFIMAIVALYSLVFTNLNGAAMVIKLPYGRLMMLHERAPEANRKNESFYKFIARELLRVDASLLSLEMGLAKKVANLETPTSLADKTTEEAWQAVEASTKSGITDRYFL